MNFRAGLFLDQNTMTINLSKRMLDALIISESVNISDTAGGTTQIVGDDSATVTDNNDGTSLINISNNTVNKGKNAVKDIISNAADKFGCELKDTTVMFSDDVNDKSGRMPVSTEPENISKGKAVLDKVKDAFSSNTGVSSDKFDLSMNAQSMMMSECVRLKKGEIYEKVIGKMSRKFKKSELI